MSNSIINHDGLYFLNVPGQDAIINEIFVEDCYNLERIPQKSCIIDIGACFGEFGIYCCVKKQCRVIAYEPSPDNYQIMEFNHELNIKRDVMLRFKDEYHKINAAIGENKGKRAFYHDPNHPAGSSFGAIENRFPIEVDSLTLLDELNKWTSCCTGANPICVKIDCEGAEKEIFKNTEWIDKISIVVLEWHNYDGHIYAEILKNKGFEVTLEGGGPKPRPTWNETIGGGLLFASRQS